jgi:hypothetical protein
MTWCTIATDLSLLSEGKLFPFGVLPDLVLVTWLRTAQKTPLSLLRVISLLGNHGVHTAVAE